jgi:hypothetical protein
MPNKNSATFLSRTLRREKITCFFLPGHSAEKKSLAFFFPDTLAKKNQLLFSSQTLWRKKITCFFLPGHAGEKKRKAKRLTLHASRITQKSKIVNQKLC